MARKHETPDAQLSLFDAFDEYTTDLAESEPTAVIIGTLEALPAWHAEVGASEGVTAAQATALASRLAEHIADRLGMLLSDFWQGAEDWKILNPGQGECAAVAAYARVKVAELGITR